MVVAGEVVCRIGSQGVTARGRTRVVESGPDVHIEYLKQADFGWQVGRGVGSFRLKVWEPTDWGALAAMVCIPGHQL